MLSEKSGMRIFVVYRSFSHLKDVLSEYFALNHRTLRVYFLTTSSISTSALTLLALSITLA